MAARSPSEHGRLRRRCSRSSVRAVESAASIAVCPLVALVALPDDQREARAGAQRARDVAEGGHGVGEEHGAEPADGEVELAGRRRDATWASPRSNVTLSSRSAALSWRARLEHLLGDVDAEHAPGCGGAGGVTRRLPGRRSRCRAHARRGRRQRRRAAWGRTRAARPRAARRGRTVTWHARNRMGFRSTSCGRVGLTIGRYLPIVVAMSRRKPGTLLPLETEILEAALIDSPLGAGLLPRIRPRPDDAGAERVAFADGPRNAVQGLGPVGGVRPAQLTLGGRGSVRGTTAPAAVRAHRAGGSGGRASPCRPCRAGRRAIPTLRPEARMTPERMAELVARWVRLYTRNLPAPIARRRADEIDADVHDHIAHERAQGSSDSAHRSRHPVADGPRPRRRRLVAPPPLDRRSSPASASWSWPRASCCCPCWAMLLTDEVAWGSGRLRHRRRAAGRDRSDPRAGSEAGRAIRRTDSPSTSRSGQRSCSSGTTCGGG